MAEVPAMTIVQFLAALEAANQKPAIEQYRDQLIDTYGAGLSDDAKAALRSGNHTLVSHQIMLENPGTTTAQLASYNVFMCYPFKPI